jgi:hypothetical protein
MSRCLDLSARKLTGSSRSSALCATSSQILLILDVELAFLISAAVGAGCMLFTQALPCLAEFDRWLDGEVVAWTFFCQ